MQKISYHSLLCRLEEGVVILRGAALGMTRTLVGEEIERECVLTGKNRRR